MEELLTKRDVATVQDVELDNDAVMAEAIKSFTTLEQIEALEAEMLKWAIVDIPVKHAFAKGIYTRQLTLPAGVIAIGNAHKHECLNIVTAGSVSVLIDGVVKKIVAPCSFVSAPGQRKVGYVHDPMTWITVHATNETDIKKIEDEIIQKSNTAIAFEESRKGINSSIASIQIDDFWLDRIDYFRAIDELGFTHEQVSYDSRITHDMIDFSGDQGNKIFMASSLIHGNGMFSTFGAVQGEVLAPARIGSKRTKAGRFVNHAYKPNCRFDSNINGDINLVAIRSIKKAEELTLDYRQARKESEIADHFLHLNSQ